MARVKVTRTNDRGFKNMLNNMSRNSNGKIATGIFRESKAQRSRVAGSDANSLAYRYAIHDEGRGNNPKRETLLPAIEKSIREDRVVTSFLNFGLDKSPAEYQRGITRAGLRLVAGVKKEITALKVPAKLQSTIEAIRRRYGGTRSNPLIATGEMKNAVNFKYSR